jgi:hemolysin activation/secretion protein
MSRVAACTLLLLIAASTAALAAETAASPPAGAGSFQLPDVSLPGAAAGAMSAGPVHVDRIVFKGNKALASKTLLATAAPYVGRDLSAAQIEELRELLTRQYTDRGYVNSGVMLDPAAPMHDGALHFLAVEGRIKDVRVRGLKRLRPAYVIDRLRGADDEILNVNLLRERFQRLLDDPLFTRLNSRILPGAELGEATLDLDVDRARPYALSVALNNYRPPSIGEKAYDVAGLVRDLSGWGDVLDADINGPIDGSGGLNYSAGWAVPLNRYYTQVSFRSSYSDTVVTEEPLEALDIKSRIERQELKLTQPLWISLVHQFNVGASVAYEKNSTSVAGLPFSFLPGAVQGVTRAVTARVAPDYSFRTEHQYLGVRLTFLHATLLDQSSTPATFAQPDHEYEVWTGQVHYLWDLPHTPLEFETRGTAQWTGARISDLHAIEVGGVDSVRGFREDELLLANVRNLNVDLRWLVMPNSGGLRPGLTLGTFFDWASGYDVGEPTTTFSSTGGTLRLKWTHLQADLAVGARLIHPSFVDQQHGSWQDHGIHAQVAWAL